MGLKCPNPIIRRRRVPLLERVKMAALRNGPFSPKLGKIPEMRIYRQVIMLGGLLLVWAGGRLAADPAQPPAGVLTNAAQIRNLTVNQAAQGLSVRLRGVVISEADPAGHAVVLADDSAGIYVLADKSLFASIHRKDAIELEGVTDPGQFAPIVRVSSVHKKGVAPIPTPRPVSYQDLITGALDGQWVEVTGVIRYYIEPPARGNIWRAYIAANGGIITVRCPGPRNPQLQADAEVRVQAVCLYQFNQRRQALTPVLQVPAGVNIRLEKPAPADPFAAPVRPADSLLRFTPDNPSGHRIHIRGVVTYAQSGSSFWIRDKEAGLRIQTRQGGELKPGDELDVLGFPTFNSFPPVLEDAVFRQTGTNWPPLPVFLSQATNAINYQDDLIALEAVLTEVQPMMEGTILTLNAGGMPFKAMLKSPPGAGVNPDWQPGGQVRITGICSVIHDDVRPMMGIWQPQTFQLLLRSPTDLEVLSRPPWWTPRHVIFLLGGVIGALLLLTGVVTLMARRRVAEQKRQRAMAEAEFSAILSERNRMAREIHDTLAQGLVATSVQLRLAKKRADDSPESLHQHIDAAQQLVRGSLEEARNSIWNMRSQILETSDLPTALEGILKQMAEGTELVPHFEVTGKPRRLAPVVESHLLRVGQEAITNAAKHAQARHIRVRLEFAEKLFRLVVADDGRGFDPASPTPGGDRFGLVGLRERAAGLNGQLDIRSAPGQGVEISLTVPLAGE